MISVSHVFASLSLSSLVFKMGRVTSHWLAAGGSGAVGTLRARWGPFLSGALLGTGSRRHWREGCAWAVARGQVGRWAGGSPFLPLYRRLGASGDCSSDVPNLTSHVASWNTWCDHNLSDAAA